MLATLTDYIHAKNNVMFAYSRGFKDRVLIGDSSSLSPEKICLYIDVNTVKKYLDSDDRRHFDYSRAVVGVDVFIGIADIDRILNFYYNLDSYSGDYDGDLYDFFEELQEHQVSLDMKLH